MVKQSVGRMGGKHPTCYPDSCTNKILSKEQNATLPQGKPCAHACRLSCLLLHEYILAHSSTCMHLSNNINHRTPHRKELQTIPWRKWGLRQHAMTGRWTNALQRKLWRSGERLANTTRVNTQTSRRSKLKSFVWLKWMAIENTVSPQTVFVALQTPFTH